MREKDQDESVTIGRYGELTITDSDIIISDSEGYEYPMNRQLFEQFVERTRDIKPLATNGTNSD
jgi:hypothetical protein